MFEKGARNKTCSKWGRYDYSFCPVKFVCELFTIRGFRSNLCKRHTKHPLP